MRRLFTAVLLLALTFHASPALAVDCGQSGTCDRAAVGAFMEGISKSCGEVGDCQLNDIMQVVVNVGNFILGIVGALVLLMYTVGGLMFLLSGFKPDWRETGKKTIINATIGLIIVFVSYAGITSLNAILRNQGDTTAVNEQNTTVCDPGSDGNACGENMICQGGACVPK